MKLSDFNIEDLTSEKYFYNKINDKYYLSEYHMEILRRNGIKYEEFGSLKELTFFIADVLLDEDNEELDALLRELDEFYYYHFVNK